MEEDIEIVEELVRNNYLEDLGYLRDNNHYIRFNQALENLIKRYQLLEHRLEVADEFIEIRKKNMIPEHYDDLKYIINECDLNSSW